MIVQSNKEYKFTEISVAETMVSVDNNGNMYIWGATIDFDELNFNKNQDIGIYATEIYQSFSNINNY